MNVVTPSLPECRRQPRIEYRRMPEEVYRPAMGRTIKRSPFRRVVTALIPVAATSEKVLWGRRIVEVLEA